MVDTENPAIRVLHAASGIVTTIAGGRLGGEGDGGPATEAAMDRPPGCGIDIDGNIFVADSNNHRVRVVGV